MALPYFRDHGWEAEVVAVEPAQVLAPHDPFLTSTLPDHVPVHRVQALSTSWGRVPGLGGLGYRCLPAVTRKVRALLQADPRPTLVYFSSTQFAVHAAIPQLAALPGVKVAMDYQDPWVSHYYHDHPSFDHRVAASNTRSTSFSPAGCRRAPCVTPPVAHRSPHAIRRT
jgi:hypothetical protein